MDAKILGKNACSRQHELETTQLRNKLQQMATLCQQLQETVEFLEKKVKSAEMQTTEVQTEDDYDDPKTYNVASLKEKMKELVSMNLNWQKFNTQQEKTIQELKDKVARLEHELETRNVGQHLVPEKQQIAFDQVLLAKKQQYNTLEDEKLKVEEENHQLKKNAESLQKALNEVKDRCQLLEAQLVVYQEDFKTERGDREKAQSRIVELEMSLKDVHRQQGLPVQATTFDPYPMYNSGAMHSYSGEMLRGRGVYQTDVDGAFGSSLNPLSATAAMKNVGPVGQWNQQSSATTSRMYQDVGIDETDGLTFDLTEDGATNHVSLSDMLSCPNCRKVFTRDQHLELVEHMEDCH